MISKLSTSEVQVDDEHLSPQGLSFSEYVLQNETLIKNNRTDFATWQKKGVSEQLIINTNSPFELYPETPPTAGKRIKYGALLIHGLLDCPFSLKDIGMRLKTQGVLSRAILLPGHGTKPADLCDVSYHKWIETVQFGIESLRKEVDQIFLVGFSTGAALSVYHALQDEEIAGIILLAPAIRIKLPAHIVVGWQYLLRMIHQTEWLYYTQEIDYAKYLSIPFNAVTQVNALIDAIRELSERRQLSCPVFMAVSREDETISSHHAIHFFSALKNQASRLLLYTSFDHIYPDHRVIARLTRNPDLGIKHYSHISIPFAPSNPHYGKRGDYKKSTRINPHQYIYGAYNRMEVKIYNALYNFGLVKYKRRELTYNPDFDFMCEQIVKFILQK